MPSGFAITPPLLLTTSLGQENDPLAQVQSFVSPDAQTVSEDFFEHARMPLCSDPVIVDERGFEKQVSPIFRGVSEADLAELDEPDELEMERVPFNPLAVQIDHERGSVIYDDVATSAFETNLSDSVGSFDELMEFLDGFIPTHQAWQLFEWLEDANDPDLSPEHVGGEPDPVRLDLGSGQMILVRFKGNYLAVEWSGLLPDDEVWELLYDASGELVFVSGHNAFIDPQIFAAGCRPNLLILKPLKGEGDAVDLDFLPLKGLVNDDVLMRDLARMLEMHGEPYSHSGSILLPGGVFPGLQGIELAHYPRISTDEDPSLMMQGRCDDRELLQNFLHAHQRIVDGDDITAILDYLRDGRALKRFRLTGDRVFAPLPDGGSVVAHHSPQRLEVSTRAGGRMWPTTLYETLTILNQLMATKHICYTLDESNTGFVMQLFVFNQAMREWQYFTRLDFDVLSMRPTHVLEDDAGKELMNDKQNFPVDEGTLHDAWEINSPSMTAMDENILRRAQLVSPSPLDDDRALQDDYANTVAEFLALVMSDIEDFFFARSGMDVFSGKQDPLLQFASFTYSNDIHALIQKYIRSKIDSDDGDDEPAPSLTVDERIILAERFRFASTHPEYAVLQEGLGDRHVQDWIDAIDRDAIYGRVKLVHEALRERDGMFSVVLDLRAGASPGCGGLPPHKKRGGVRRSTKRVRDIREAGLFF